LGQQKGKKKNTRMGRKRLVGGEKPNCGDRILVREKKLGTAKKKKNIKPS